MVARSSGREWRQGKGKAVVRRCTLCARPELVAAKNRATRHSWEEVIRNFEWAIFGMWVDKPIEIDGLLCREPFGKQVRARFGADVLIQHYVSK